MNYVIIFCAVNLIYISVAYVVFRIYSRHEKTNRVRDIIIILGTAFVAWVVAHVFKDMIMHPRPDATLALITPDSVYSFPSGHATFMFTLAFVMYHFDKHAGKIVAILALVAGIARVLSGIHFWYDILGGFILAGIIAYIVQYSVKRIRV